MLQRSTVTFVALCWYNQVIINSKQTKREAERLIGCAGRSVGSSVGCQNSGQYRPLVQVQKPGSVRQAAQSASHIFFFLHFLLFFI